MVECRNCGSENYFDGAVFCKQCGAQLSASVAVDVADERTMQEDTAKISSTGANQSSTPNAKQESEDFTVEDVADQMESMNEQASKKESEEGGVDKLLNLYGNESRLEKAVGSDDFSDEETSGLSLESPSDYLLRDKAANETESPRPSTSPIESKNKELTALHKLSEIQSKLTPIVDDEPDVKSPLASAKSKSDTVPTEEKDRLLASLNKSLASDTSHSTSSELSNPHRHESDKSENAVKSPNEKTANKLATSSSLRNGQLDRIELDPAAGSSPTVFLQGRKLTFPEGTRLVPGDQISWQDQRFTVRRGAVDRRSWILGGVLGFILVAIFVVQSLTAPEPVRATVFGVVTNSESNEVLAGASVSIPQLNMSTVTDEHGVFKFIGIDNGRYDVKIEGELYEARFFPVIIKDNQSDIVYGSVTPILPKLTSAYKPAPVTTTNSNSGDDAPQFGTLIVNSNVDEAQIFIDGKSVGQVNQSLKRMKPGNRTLVIRADGYEEASQVVNISPGETTELTANLLAIAKEQPVEYTAEDFFQQAEALFTEAKYTEAIGYYTLALAKNGSMVKAILRRAEAHLQAGKRLNARADYRSAADLYINSGMYSQAVVCYDKIIEFQPDASDAYSLRGWARISAGDYDEGLGDLQKALSFAPEDIQSQFEIGRAYYVTNRYKDAEKTLKKIRKQADGSPEIYGYLALTYLAQGEENDARKTYESFRKVASSAQVARMSTESGWQRLTAIAGN